MTSVWFDTCTPEELVEEPILDGRLLFCEDIETNKGVLYHDYKDLEGVLHRIQIGSVTLNPEFIGSFSHNRKTGSDVGEYSFAEGYNCEAIGEASHAEGNNTKAVADGAHSEGHISQAKGRFSHAEGDNSLTLGDYSHAEGEGTGTAETALAAHVEGHGTVANNPGEHAEGCYNVSHVHDPADMTDADSESTISSIGIGTNNSPGNQKNAIEVMKNGDVYVLGVGGYDGVSISTAQTLQEVIASLTS